MFYCFYKSYTIYLVVQFKWYWKYVTVLFRTTINKSINKQFHTKTPFQPIVLISNLHIETQIDVQASMTSSTPLLWTCIRIPIYIYFSRRKMSPKVWCILLFKIYTCLLGYKDKYIEVIITRQTFRVVKQDHY